MATLSAGPKKGRSSGTGPASKTKAQSAKAAPKAKMPAARKPAAKKTAAKSIASKSKTKTPAIETPAVKNKAKSTKLPLKTRVKAASQLKPAAKTPGEGAAKVKRARVPGDLASQYGERVKERKVSPAAAERKARRDAEERAKIRAMMAPSDALIERLTQMGVVKNGSPVVYDGPVDETEENEEPVKARRSRKWEVTCGFCGRSTTHTGAAGLCRCGALLVREG